MVSLAEMSVAGSVDLKYRHTGLAWWLTFTADKALELGAEPMQRHHCRRLRFRWDPGRAAAHAAVSCHLSQTAHNISAQDKTNSSSISRSKEAGSICLRGCHPMIIGACPSGCAERRSPTGLGARHILETENRFSSGCDTCRNASAADHAADREAIVINPIIVSLQNAFAKHLRHRAYTGALAKHVQRTAVLQDRVS